MLASYEWQIIIIICSLDLCFDNSKQINKLKLYNDSDDQICDNQMITC